MERFRSDMFDIIWFRLFTFQHDRTPKTLTTIKRGTHLTIAYILYERRKCLLNYCCTHVYTMYTNRFLTILIFLRYSLVINDCHRFILPRLRFTRRCRRCAFVSRPFDHTLKTVLLQIRLIQIQNYLSQKQ